MKKPVLLITFFLLIVSALSIAQVAISNRVSTTGIELENLQSSLNMYKKQNTLLEEKILRESSLSNIHKKAKKMGFIEAKSKLFINNPLPLALGQSR